VNDSLKQILKPFASLRLTVILLAAAMVLIFAGTWAQIDADIFRVQKEYFHAWFCWIPFGLFWWRISPGVFRIPGGFPFVGGYALIALLLANLLAAHLVRFKLNWKRSGIILIHLGLILLLTGEVLTSLFATEGSMRLTPNVGLNYVQDIHNSELAITDSSPADHDNVTVIPASMIDAAGKTIHDDRLPFDVRVEDYYVNSQPLGPFQDGPPVDPRINAGTQVGRRIVSVPPFTGAGSDADKVDLPAAIVTLLRDGKSLGTWLVSGWTDGPQSVTLPDGRVYQIDLRYRRIYKPYTLELLHFTHEQYVGSDIDKNFASLVRLIDPSQQVDRQTLIWMNHPLRYNGETFYQQGFDQTDATATTIQIVKNPNWLLPYIALGIAFAGLLIQFGSQLIRFLVRQTKAPALAPTSRATSRWPAVGALALAAVIIASSLYRPAGDPSPFDLDTFGKIPINYDGRPMPLDTLARTSLKIMHGSETLVAADGHQVTPIQWLLDVMGKADTAMDYPTFRIDNPDLLGAIGLDASKKYFSFNELLQHKDKLQPELDRVFNQQQNQPDADVDVTDRKFLELGKQLSLHVKLAQLDTLLVVPPLEPGQQWTSIGDAVKTLNDTGNARPGLRPFMTALDRYHADKPEEFNTAVADYHAMLAHALPMEAKVDFETQFNRLDPFSIALYLYVGVLLLGIFSWLGWQRPLTQAALALMSVAFIIHMAGLVSRIYISGRPPVTNLYSSAVFIAFGGVALCIGLELLYRNGIGAVVGAAIGFSSLMIAQGLSLEGDTMEQLRAVLDTNFWLATHVVCITLGYASTFVCGLLAIVYILRGVFTTQLDADLRKTVARMVYGIVCFAVLFSFVGTILGGIWADQSWGRFWGWDPKENGAILIVLWNAIILHSRWGGLVRERGLMVLAVFGNVVTSWSWFGTNMLGVGLHSYGFTSNARLMLLVGFVLSQLFIMGIGLLPTSIWRSFAQVSAPARPPVRAAKAHAAPSPV